VAEIWRFLYFSRWQPPPSWIFKISIFQRSKRSRGWNCITMHHYASLCQILWKSLQPWPRYRDFSIFQHGGRRRLIFSTFEIFNVRNGKEGRTASPCQMSSKSLERRPRICEFQYYASLAWKCLFTPLFGFLGTYPPNDVMMSLIVLTVKRTILGLNHVIWAINREYFPRFLNGSYKIVLYFPLD